MRRAAKTCAAFFLLRPASANGEEVRSRAGESARIYPQLRPCWQVDKTHCEKSAQRPNTMLRVGLPSALAWQN